jgi:hypothetical protein
MATYIVFTKESTQDQSEFNTYQIGPQNLRRSPGQASCCLRVTAGARGPGARGCRNHGGSNYDGRTRMV